MKYYDVCTKREYEHEGQQKAQWFRVGTLKETDHGGRYLRLNHLPDITFYVFDQEDREDSETSDTEE